MYSPYEFGLYSVFLAILAPVQTIATLRFDLAIPVASNSNEAEGLATLAKKVLRATVVLVTVTILLFLTISGRNVEYLMLLPLALLAAGQLQIHGYYLTRHRFFREISVCRFIANSSAGLVQAIGGGINGGVFTLAGGVVLGNAAGAIILSRVAAKLRHHGSAFAKSISTMALVKSYRAFPLFTTWTALISNLSVHVPVFIVSVYYGTDVTGQFGLSTRFLFLPLALIANAVSQVLLSNAAEAHKAGTLKRQVEQVFLTLCGVSFIVLAPIGLVAPQLFQFVFGENWHLAGEFARSLTPLLVFVLTGAPLQNVPLVLNRQRADSFLNLALFTLRVGTLIVAAEFNSASTAVLIFSLVSAFSWVLYHVWVFSMLGIELKRLVSGFSRTVVVSLPAVLFALWPGTSVDSNVGLSAVWVYFALLLISAGSLFVHLKFNRLP